MLGKVFNERGFLALEKGLEALSLRHRVISDNVANANTPGFKKSEVSFAFELSRFLDARDRAGSGPAGAEAAAFRPRVFRVAGTSQRLDGNNVDVEEEMAKLAENTLLYEATTRQISSELTRLRLAISEGRR